MFAAQGFAGRLLDWAVASDYERDPPVSEELIRWAGINQMLRRVIRGETRYTAVTAPARFC